MSSQLPFARKRVRPRNTVAPLRDQPGDDPQQELNKDLSDVEEKDEEGRKRN